MNKLKLTLFPRLHAVNWLMSICPEFDVEIEKVNDEHYLLVLHFPNSLSANHELIALMKFNQELYHDDGGFPSAEQCRERLDVVLQNQENQWLIQKIADNLVIGPAVNQC